MTRHGETIGYFIPSRENRAGHDLTSLKTVAAKLDELLATHSINEDEIVSEFQVLRSDKVEEAE